ncbi:MAG: HTH domain-containing protein [Clostridia bacterium]|nr:HTH domain-containing protein [Clostridia bacterium]
MYTNKTIRRRLGVLECMKENMTTEQMAEEFKVSRRTIQKDIQYIRMIQEEKREK